MAKTALICAVFAQKMGEKQEVDKVGQLTCGWILRYNLFVFIRNGEEKRVIW
jgi:hypothetical protein